MVDALQGLQRQSEVKVITDVQMAEGLQEQY
jgi:hypothetical protein